MKDVDMKIHLPPERDWEVRPFTVADQQRLDEGMRLLWEELRRFQEEQHRRCFPYLRGIYKE